MSAEKRYESENPTAEYPLDESYKLVAFGPERVEYDDLVARGYDYPVVWVLGPPETAKDRVHMRCRTLMVKFEQEILDGLRSGEFNATGRDTRRPLPA